MKYYTGVGSRETPSDVQDLIVDIAFKLASKGYTLRSGAAAGADSLFEYGVVKYWEQSTMDYPEANLAQIYIPWSGFAKSRQIIFKDWYKVLDRMSKKEEAYHLASEIHPAWDKCSKGAKALHARNTFQILGSGLNNPSSFLICWAQVDKHGKIKGGTATAWELAKANGVPCFNLYNEDDKQRLIKFVEAE